MVDITISETPSKSEPASDAEPSIGQVESVAKILRDHAETLQNPEDRDLMQPLEITAEDVAKELKQEQAKPEGEPGPVEISAEGLGMDLPEREAGEMAFAELAEKAGVTVEDLYATEIPLGGDAGLTTLGALKDSVQDFAQLDDKRTAFEDHRSTFERDMIRSRGELQEVIKLLPEIPPELVQHAQNQFADNLAKERQALYAIRPDWKDPEVFQHAQDEVFEVVKDYGFTRNDLDTVVDHRLTKLLWDFQTMAKRIAAANAGRKRVVKQSQQQRARKAVPATGLQAQLQAAKESSSTETKVGAVQALLSQ